MSQPFLTKSEKGIILDVWVVPGSSRETISGLYGDFLKLKVVQPPESGKANKGVCAFFAKLLGLQQNAVELISGPTNRHKRLVITGITIEDAENILSKHL